MPFYSAYFLHYLKAMLLPLPLCLMLLPSTVNAQRELIITRGDGNWPPYEMVQDGQLTGFHIELIQSVANSIGVIAMFKPYPWRRAVRMVTAGRADAVTYITKSKKREESIYFSEHNILSGTDHLLAKLKQRHDIKFDGNLTTLKPYSMVHIAGYTFGQAFDSADDLDKTGVASASDVIELISKKRYDLGIVSPVDLEGAVDLNLMQNIVLLKPALYSSIVYIGFSKQSTNQALVDEFTHAMQAFKLTKSYQRLKEKYGL
ncbi:substrate-binding periplasmic protein [Vibrio genomosp. F10]|uniref:substrate-binding periplasmic protein n=1 Tax=Vibrio genomosp. F10 TaxID=723171 RepID=UPI00037FB1FC|nr:transporter substrate-binding domain-containing protein [Vibrio genomosp. F10]OEF09400.1 hypothetical protein A1QI_14515 [Vibrio genomosp. F10 str. 9ZB36]